MFNREAKQKKFKMESLKEKKKSKIEVMKHNQIYMWWLGIFSYRLTEPTLESHKFILAYHNAIFPIFSIVSSAVFIYQNPTEMQAVLETILVMIALYQAECTFLNTAFQMKNIKLLHLKLQGIVDEGILHFFFQFFEKRAVFGKNPRNVVDLGKKSQKTKFFKVKFFFLDSHSCFEGTGIEFCSFFFSQSLQLKMKSTKTTNKPSKSVAST